MTCDPITYAPKEAILAKDAYSSLYEAFEVETGTCPIAGCTDNDGDGFAIDGGNCGPIDCNDNDPNINPDAKEICDGVDNDCDDLIDEGFDKDDDGVADCFDYCPKSKPNEPVDQNGCDIFQFCESKSCGYDCFYADWKNNEPNTKYPYDCTVVVVLRNGKEVTFPINEQGVADVLAQNEAKAYFTPRFPVVIDSLLPNGSAKASGLVKGDKIVAINGKPVKYFDELGTELANFKNQNVVLDVERNSAVQKMNIKVDPQGKLGFSTDLNVAQAELE